MSEDKQFFYANSVEVAVSAFDFNLKFLRNGTSASNPKQNSKQHTAKVRANIELRDEMVIGMSPQHAKAMLPHLTEMLKAYEETFGPLPDIAKLQEQITL